MKTPHWFPRNGHTIAAIALTLCAALFALNSQAQTDYFLRGMTNGAIRCISPDGGVLDNHEGTTVQYWNIPKVVQPGQTVQCAIGYTWSTNAPNSIVYKMVLAEWQPDSPLVILENGELQGNIRTVRKEFSFTAPTLPGTYRLRLAMTWAFQGIQHFYGDGPPGLSDNPGVGPFCEVQIKVASPSQTDHFLQAITNGAIRCISPDGGVLDNFEGTKVQYWNIPKVVQPGQTVQCAIGYTWSTNAPNSIVYKTVLSEWQPDSPIAILENGELQGGIRAVRKEFSFTAPTAPGTYRLRLAMTWAFQGIQHFHGDGPPGDSNNPGVGSFCEVEIKVASSPRIDYFLQGMTNGSIRCISQDGGVLDNHEGTTVQYWNVPKVVLPGQTVESAIGYTWTTNAPNSIIYKTVLADWQPDSPIAILENGELQGEIRTVRKGFSFIAPTSPGTYRLRLAMTWAFQGIQSFYGDGPQGPSANPGVGPYAEVFIQVQTPLEKIVYVTGSDQIKILDSSTGVSTAVPVSDLQTLGYPSWSPDGQWIVFNGQPGVNNHNSQIWVVRPDGADLRRVTDGSGNLVFPIWSPDGNRIAFHQVYGDVSIINFDGTGRTNLPIQIGHIRWSPDGGKIAGVSWALAGEDNGLYVSDVYIYDLTTGTTNKLTTHTTGEAHVFVEWSPDGTKLAVSKIQGPNRKYDIVLMNADGSNPVNLTADWPDSDEKFPTWTPDGKHFLFESDHGGNRDLWVMRSDGTGRFNLTKTPEDEHGPAYLPAARLSFSLSGGNLILAWPSGNLLSTDELGGAWTEETGASSPWYVSPIAPQKFFKIRQ